MPITPAPIRIRIVCHYFSGMPPIEIALLYDLDLRTVERWIKRWEETGEVNPLKSTGRPRKLSQDDQFMLCAAAIEDPFKGAMEIWKELGLDCSYFTANNWLNKNGLKSYVANQTP